MSNFTLQEYKDIDTYLLYELGMVGALNENRIRNLTAKQSILTESVEDVGFPDILLNEVQAYDNAGRVYDLPRLSAKYESSQGVLAIKHGLEKPGETLRVPMGEVARAWEDVKNIKTYREFFERLGVPPFELWIRSPQSIGNLGPAILKIYNKEYVPDYPEEASVLPTWNKRQRFYQAQNSYNTSADASQMTRKDPSQNIGKGNIDTGAGRRTNSRTIQNINQDNIFNGEFYRDRSRIKRGVLYKFIQMLKRQSDNSHKKMDFGTFRVWKKTFLLGYFVENTMFFEVWYNSYNSKFVVYDMNGVEKAEPTDSLQESIRMLVRIVAQESPDDRDVLSTNRGGRDLSTSVANAMAKNIRPELKNKMREDEDIRREKRKEDAQEDKEQRSKDRRDKAKSVAGNISRGAASRAASGAKRATDYAKDQARQADDNIKQAEEEIRREKEREQKKRRQQEEFRRTWTKKKREAEEARTQQNYGPEYDSDDSPQEREEKKKKLAQIAQKADEEEAEANAQSSNDNMTDPEAGARKSAANGAGVQGELFTERLKEAFSDIIDAEDDFEVEDGTYSDMSKAEREEREAQQAADEKEEEEENNQIIDFEGREFDQTAQDVQAYALRSPYTKQMLLGDIDDAIEMYKQTRVQKRSVLRRLVDKLRPFRGRRERVVNPQTSFSKGSYIRRFGSTVFNEGVRADFIIGFTLNDIVNIEIWYITEFEPKTKGYVSSFYVYDVDAMKYVRTNLPYYRNAMQVVGQKLSVPLD